MNKLNQKLRTVDLDHFAFYQGAQGIPFTETNNEIEARYREQQAKLEEDSSQRQKPIEAAIEKLERAYSQVEGAWREIEGRLGPYTPSFFTAYLVGCLALAALVIDSILIGPGLDMVGVSDPAMQLIAAFGLASLFSLIFHLVHETFVNDKIDRATKTVWRILGGLSVIALIGWGILRGFQVRFAADITENPLGRFLGDHPVLSSIFFCFITLAAPLVGAAAIFYAQPRIQDRINWNRAKNQSDSLHASLSDAQKMLDAERAALQYQKAQLDAQKQTWQASAVQYHDRGESRGARQAPHWLVVLKATLWSLAGVAIAWFVGPLVPPLYLVLPAGIWMGAFLYYRHRRFHPSYDQFKGLENTHFAVSTDRRPQIEIPATPKLLPRPEDRK